MEAITLEEAQQHLGDIIREHPFGSDIAILENGVVVAHLVVKKGPLQEPFRRKLGTMAGSVLYMAPNFDAPLEEMLEYME